MSNRFAVSSIRGKNIFLNAMYAYIWHLRLNQPTAIWFYLSFSLALCELLLSFYFRFFFAPKERLGCSQLAKLNIHVLKYTQFGWWKMSGPRKIGVTHANYRTVRIKISAIVLIRGKWLNRVAWPNRIYVYIVYIHTLLLILNNLCILRYCSVWISSSKKKWLLITTRAFGVEELFLLLPLEYKQVQLFLMPEC